MVTLILPVVAPFGTVALIEVADRMKNDAATPLNLTELAPLRYVPLSVTEAPVGPLAGVKLEIVGGSDGVTTYELRLETVAVGSVTLPSPVVAPAGTVARIDVGERTANEAATPLNFTAVVPVKPTPENETIVPTGPLPGDSPVSETVGVNVPALVPLATGVVTAILPALAPLGTTALS